MCSFIAASRFITARLPQLDVKNGQKLKTEETGFIIRYLGLHARVFAQVQEADSVQVFISVTCAFCSIQVTDLPVFPRHPTPSLAPRPKRNEYLRQICLNWFMSIPRIWDSCLLNEVKT